MHPRPPPPDRPVTARTVVFAVLGWAGAIGLSVYVVRSGGWRGVAYVALALSVLTMAALVGIALRTAVRCRNQDTGHRVRRSLAEFARGCRRVFFPGLLWQTVLSRFFLYANAGIVLLAMVTGDWRLLGWTMLGFAGVLVVGMIGFFAAGRTDPPRHDPAGE